MRTPDGHFPHPDYRDRMAALLNPAEIVDLTKNCPSGQLPPTAVAVSVLLIGQLRRTKMVRRIYVIAFTLVMASIGFISGPAAAQTGRTFYIDYASGSNSNPGTKTSPWKTHPY